MRFLEKIRVYFRSSLSRKFMVSIVLVNAALVAAIGWQIYNRDRIAQDFRQVRRAEAMARVLAAVGTADRDRAQPDLQRVAEAAVKSNWVALVTFRDSSGRIVAKATAPNLAQHRSTLPATEIRTHGALRVSRTENMIIASAPVPANRDPAGTVEVGISRLEVIPFERQSAVPAMALGIAIIFLGGLIAYLTGRSITERLAHLSQVADRFRLGERGARLSDGGHDEVARTARGLNAMLAAVAESERALKDVCRIACIGSWRYDPATRDLELSETLQEILALEPGARPPIEQLDAALSRQQRMRLVRLLKAGADTRRFTFTCMLRVDDAPPRTLWIEARLEHPPTAAQPMLAGICQDITDRESKDAQLRQAQKMEVVGQLTGGLAHDFNNLLAIVIGNLDLLDEELAGGSEARELIDEALGAAVRGAELTGQLLAFARRQPLSPRRVDLNRLVSDGASLWRRTLTESIDVRIHLADEVWPTRIDISQLESAILNLVVNARDAMPDGGVIAIETANVSIAAGDWNDGKELDIASGDYAVISVSDNGIGMPPHVAARVFEPFFTTKAVGQGSGLGLSMIYGFAKQSGGSVKIYSEVGEGTTVRLYLPRYRAKDADVPETAELEPAPSTGTERILMVEDNDSVRRVVTRQLEDLGYSVVTASNASEALLMLERDDAIDLLFTDVVMPGGMNGFELARQAQKLRPSLKVLHTTGFTRLIDTVADANGPPPEILTKPYRKFDLAIKVRQVLDA